jgi:hypothetical protein
MATLFVTGAGLKTHMPATGLAILLPTVVDVTLKAPCTTLLAQSRASTPPNGQGAMPPVRLSRLALALQ